MNKLILFAFILFFMVIMQYFLPWWTLIIPAFFLGYLSENSKKVFFIGFFTVFLLWLCLTFLFDLFSSQLISIQMANVLYMPNKYVLFGLSSIIGGIVGGLSSLLCFFIRTNTY